MIAYKLVRKRRNGSLGPLFINRKQVLALGKPLVAESHPTKGFAVRPGWHCTAKPVAPHLKLNLKNGEQRVWVRVEIRNFETIQRPVSQGGKWYLAKRIRFLEEL